MFTLLLGESERSMTDSQGANRDFLFTVTWRLWREEIPHATHIIGWQEYEDIGSTTSSNNADGDRIGIAESPGTLSRE